MNTKTMSLAGLGVTIIVALTVLSFNRASPLASLEGTATTTQNGSLSCTMEAKICPDGSSVGRSGPNCEFTACPTATSSDPIIYHTGDTVTVTARIGQTVTALGEELTPIAVLDDSRCPTDVQCIWAGTVRLDARVLSGMGNGQITFELGKIGTTEINSFKLESVSPAKRSTQEIAPGDYEFTFKVTRR